VRLSRGFIAHDAAFTRVTGRSPVIELVAAVDAHEGPVYIPGEDALYVTSVPAPASVVRRLELAGDRFPIEPDAVSTVPAALAMPNGMALDHEGQLIVCEQGDGRNHARVSRLDPTAGARTTITDGWRGKRFNSPNDVAVAPDGRVWFTDPAYGHLQGFRPAPELGDFVYCCDPASGDVDCMADGFDKPNGIVLSPDGGTLYVTDSGANQAAGSFHVDRPHHVVGFDVSATCRLSNRRVVAVTAPGIPDGLKVDADGRIYVSSEDRVLVLTPDGALLGEVLVAGAVNFTFGGPDGNVLFVTADTEVFAVALEVAGPCPCPIPSPQAQIGG
jgi:gluconolactonase